MARQTASFIRGESNSARRVGADFWDVLGIDYKGQHQMVRLRHGALIILYADKQSKPLTTSDIKNVVSKDNLDKALMAEDGVREMADAIAGSANCTPDVTAEICKFQAACFALLMNKVKVDVITRITNELDIEAGKLQLGNLQWHFTEQVSKLLGTSLTKSDFNAFAMQVKVKDTADSADAGVSCRDNSIDNTASVLQDIG